MSELTVLAANSMVPLSSSMIVWELAIYRAASEEEKRRTTVGPTGCFSMILISRHTEND